MASRKKTVRTDSRGDHQPTSKPPKSRPKRTPVARPKSPRRSRAAAAKHKASAAPRHDTVLAKTGPKAPLDRALAVEVEPSRLEETLGNLFKDFQHWANQGRYTKVRFKFRGKTLLPDLPLAAVVAAEGLTFYWGGILRALAVNVAGGGLLQVELVHDAEKKVQEGKEALLRADLDAALSLFQEAVSMDRHRASAHLNLGIAQKLSGNFEAARQSFRSARDLDAKGLVGAEAERLLKTLG